MLTSTKRPTKKRNTSTASRPGSLAAKTVLQWLFVTNKSLTVDVLREKLREFYKDEARGELRAVASVTNVELVSALLEANQTLEPMGLQFRMVNGVVSVVTSQVESKRLAEELSANIEQRGSSDLSAGALEVLSCIAFKQPICQAEIDRLFATDKRSIVVKLRDMNLIEEFPAEGGRLRFVTTDAFLRRFNLKNVDELHQVLSQQRRAAQEGEY